MPSCHVSQCFSLCCHVTSVFQCVPSYYGQYFIVRRRVQPVIYVFQRVPSCHVFQRALSRCVPVSRQFFFFECVPSCRVSVFYRVMISVSVSAIVLRQRFGVCAAVVSYQCFIRVMTVSVTPTRNVCRRVVSVTLYRRSHQCFGVCSCVMSGVCHRLSSS